MLQATNPEPRPANRDASPDAAPPSRAAERPRTAWTAAALPVLLYTAAFLAMTYPAVASFGTHFFCDEGDGLQNVWNAWWTRKAIVELHQSPWFTTWLHHPYGTTLLGHTLSAFNGLVGIPLSLLLSPRAASSRRRCSAPPRAIRSSGRTCRRRTRRICSRRSSRAAAPRGGTSRSGTGWIPGATSTRRASTWGSPCWPSRCSAWRDAAPCGSPTPGSGRRSRRCSTCSRSGRRCAGAGTRSRQALRQEPGVAGVLDLSGTSTFHALYLQTLHEKPIAFGHVSRVPRSVLEAGGVLVRDVELGLGGRIRDEHGFRYLVTDGSEPTGHGVLHEGAGARLYDLATRF